LFTLTTSFIIDKYLRRGHKGILPLFSEPRFDLVRDFLPSRYLSKGLIIASHFFWWVCFTLVSLLRSDSLLLDLRYLPRFGSSITLLMDYQLRSLFSVRIHILVSHAMSGSRPLTSFFILRLLGFISRPVPLRIRHLASRSPVSVRSRDRFFLLCLFVLILPHIPLCVPSERSVVTPEGLELPLGELRVATRGLVWMAAGDSPNGSSDLSGATAVRSQFSDLSGRGISNQSEMSIYCTGRFRFQLLDLFRSFAAFLRDSVSAQRNVRAPPPGQCRGFALHPNIRIYLDC
jgi:hypothetical protein